MAATPLAHGELADATYCTVEATVVLVCGAVTFTLPLLGPETLMVTGE